MKTLHPNILSRLKQQSRSLVRLNGARWLVYPKEENVWRALMSKAQFVYVNAPVVAIRREGGVDFLDEEGRVGWSTNKAWPRANLQMHRIIGQGALRE